MPCFHPLAAWLSTEGDIAFYKRRANKLVITPKKLRKNFRRDIQLPCGRCIGCRLERGRQWATRCLHEAAQHEANCFVTLTIDETHPERELIAPKGSLSIRTHQKFMKRLRARTSQKPRFYMCGEYGDKFGKPHYHYLIFGYDFVDKKYFKKSNSGKDLYTSETLNEIWPYGHAWIGDVEQESCAYVANYVMKKITGEKALEHYARTDNDGNEYHLVPEFNLMSRRPGIARTWWDKYHQDVTTLDAIVQPGGIKAKPPRYYDKLLELANPELLEQIKTARETKGRALSADNTPARLAVKETVQAARLNLKKRNLETT